MTGTPGLPDRKPRIVLVAPNISKRMGGEAAKALQIFEGLTAMGYDVVQVTHARVRDEMQALLPGAKIRYVEDGPTQIFLFRTRLNWPLMFVGAWLLHREAVQAARDHKAELVHFTSPISPSLPYFRFPGTRVVIGPLNGNILHPPTLMDRETRAKRIGAALLVPAQKILGALFPGKKHATLLVAGGERTEKALAIGGCRREQMVPTLDSGVDRMLAAAPRLSHSGVNPRFVFAGRLIRYKGCDLAIRALHHAPAATLDVIGEGAERPALEALAEREGLADRVRFLGWVEAGAPLFAQLRNYRAFVFPTLAEANGIVVQEAMMLGLPVIAVDWGGPALLLTDETGILVAPKSEAEIILSVGQAMNRLVNDADEAERLSVNARNEAERAGFSWPNLLKAWAAIYDRVMAAI